MCVYGDMELQERATVAEFMTGPLEKMANKAVTETVSDYANSILGYLLGFTPKLDVKEEKNERW